MARMRLLLTFLPPGFIGCVMHDCEPSMRPRHGVSEEAETVRMLAIWGRLAVFALVVVSCTPWRVEYLREATNRATQDDLVRQLGPPHFTTQLTTGETVWTYQYRSSYVSGVGGIVSGRTDCKEYILTFDQAKTLREWKRQGC